MPKYLTEGAAVEIRFGAEWAPGVVFKREHNGVIISATHRDERFNVSVHRSVIRRDVRQKRRSMLCPECGGAGKIRPSRIFGYMYDEQSSDPFAPVECSACAGEGRLRLDDNGDPIWRNA